MQNLKNLKTNLWFEKFVRFSPEHLKVSKLGHLWGTFIQKRKIYELKFRGKLCVMTMKNNAKFEKELTCQFKIQMRSSRSQSTLKK